MSSFRIRTRIIGPAIWTYGAENADGALLVALEGDPTRPELDGERLLAEVVGARLREETIELESLARAVERALLDLPSTPTMFIGAIWRSKVGASICWAGTMRCHWLRGSTLVARTTEHVLATDPLVDRAAVDPALLDAHATMATRMIGGTSGALESVQWPMLPGDVAVLCNDAYHQFDAPERYLDQLARDLDGRSELDPPVGYGGSRSVLLAEVRESE